MLTVSSYFFAIYLFLNMTIRPISVTFFFTVHSFYEYVQSNQLHTHDRKNLSQQEQPFFFNALLFFLGVSVSSLLNKESMVKQYH